MAIARNVAVPFAVQIDNITVGTGALRPTAANLDYEADRDSAMVEGETEVEVYHNHVRRISFDFYPAGATANAANSAQHLDASAGQKLKPGKSITIVSANDPELARGWIIDRSRKQKRTDGHVVITVEAHCYETHGVNMAANEITV